MKTIYILLTRSTTLVSRMIHYTTSADYTHVSIAFDEDLKQLYSSARKNGRTMFPAGPCKENLRKGYYKKHMNIPCSLYKLEVTDEVYEQAKAAAEYYIRNEQYYQYNILGLLLCRMGIPYNRSHKYFCSEFVGEILEKSGAMELEKQPSLIRPIDYTDMPDLSCEFEGTLLDLLKSKNQMQYA